MSLFNCNNYNINSGAVGASIPLPGSIPTEVINAGFSLRREKFSNGKLRNEFLGSVVTYPTIDEIVVGDSYFDLKDNQCDETFFLYDRKYKQWERLQGKELEKRYKEQGFYKNAHKGDKKYLVVNQFITQLINLIMLKNGN